MKTVFLLLIVLGSVVGASDSEYRITSADELITFAKSIDSVTNYFGTTVFLDSDIVFTKELSEQFIPIGDGTNFFLGTFDGQGHTISNLKINSSLGHVGLFGYSTGLTIKNVVLDYSCSITSSYSGYSINLGGIIGECYAYDGNCNIESNINMANLSYSGDNIIVTYFGGIAGAISSSADYSITVKNCANYGSITHSGTSDNIYIGGIVGTSSNTNYKYIQNCVNYGTITHSGYSSDCRYIGGIVGNVGYSCVENCLSAGKIFVNNEPQTNYVGSIVGYASYDSSIMYCFWTSDVDVDKYGDGALVSMIGTPTSPVTVSDAVIALNNQTAHANTTWNRWLYNKNNATVSFTVCNSINCDRNISLSSQAILSPDLAGSNESAFSGWYSDDLLTSPFAQNETDTDIALYGMLCRSSNYTVTLDVNGGNASSLPSLHPMLIECNGVYGSLPNPTRTEAVFNGWFTESAGGEKIEHGSSVTSLNDHTLYAQWTINKYTVTFVSDGNVVQSDALEYGSIISPPGDQTKAGHTFNGWNNSIATVPGYNVTVSANFTVNRYTVTFEFNNGTDPEARTIEYNSYINRPVVLVKEGYTFTGWDNDTEYMPPENITITALWSPNEYTVAFDVNGGDELDGNEKEVVITFDAAYGGLPIPTRVGHIFNGWFTDKNESVKSVTIVKTPRNHTLCAQWIEVVETKHVEIVFGKKDLKEKDIKEIVNKYTNASFVIIDIVENNEPEETRVIIKFVDNEEARNFIETIAVSSYSIISIIKRVGFAERVPTSFSLTVSKSLFFGILML